MAKKTTGAKAKPKAAAKPKRDKKKPLTKTQLFQELADKTGLTKKQVTDFFEAFEGLIHTELAKRAAGAITLPNLVKLVRAEKPATKARKGRNPATGEEITIAAKPKSTVIRARVLKPLKEAATK